MAELRFEQVSKVYAANPAIVDVNLVVPSGSFTVMIGPSGCGKTTLLEIAAALVPPTTGRVLLEGKLIVKPGPEMAIVFQRHNLFEWMSVQDNVAFGLRTQGLGRHERRLRAGKMLADVGLIEHARKLPRELSGGMQQRVAIARALVLNPQVLLMDEPFSALDYQTRRVMQRYLLAMWHHARATILMVTHDLDEALTLADQVVLFSGTPGRIIETIPLQLDHPRNPEDPCLRELRTYLRHHLEREVALGEFTPAELAVIDREGVAVEL